MFRKLSLPLIFSLSTSTTALASADWTRNRDGSRTAEWQTDDGFDIEGSYFWNTAVGTLTIRSAERGTDWTTVIILDDIDSTDAVDSMADAIVREGREIAATRGSSAKLLGQSNNLVINLGKYAVALSGFDRPHQLEMLAVDMLDGRIIADDWAAVRDDLMIGNPADIIDDPTAGSDVWASGVWNTDGDQARGGIIVGIPGNGPSGGAQVDLFNAYIGDWLGNQSTDPLASGFGHADQTFFYGDALDWTGDKAASLGLNYAKSLGLFGDDAPPPATNPDTPDTPDNPDTPDTPDNPDNPDTTGTSSVASDGRTYFDMDGDGVIDSADTDGDGEPDISVSPSSAPTDAPVNPAPTAATDDPPSTSTTDPGDGEGDNNVPLEVVSALAVIYDLMVQAAVIEMAINQSDTTQPGHEAAEDDGPPPYDEDSFIDGPSDDSPSVDASALDRRGQRNDWASQTGVGQDEEEEPTGRGDGMGGTDPVAR